MKIIGLLSDTHSYIDQKILDFFKNCDEVWHAGDIGDIEVINKITEIKPLKAVYGNIDGQDIRITFPKVQLFECEGVKVLMTHIGGYPGRYQEEVRQIFQEMIKKTKPDLFISGHSHILKVIFDKKYNLLHINPGAAGKSGFHKVITAVRFKIEGKEIKELEIYEKSRV